MHAETEMEVMPLNRKSAFRYVGAEKFRVRHRADWLFARWERALQFAERDRALAAGEPIEPDRRAVPPCRRTSAGRESRDRVKRSQIFIPYRQITSQLMDDR